MDSADDFPNRLNDERRIFDVDVVSGMGRDDEAAAMREGGEVSLQVHTLALQAVCRDRESLGVLAVSARQHDEREITERCPIGETRGVHAGHFFRRPLHLRCLRQVVRR